ncbi:uncharacterized protein [Primulina eburnea]|uniref:uncharacterized protein n=1 Tax=Primulina eburnea TaxID=1245227 RepID=UPI003C6C8051
MERQFHIQFYRTEPEVCIADLSRVTQKKGESMESMEYFIDMFKKIKNRCKVFLPETEFVKMAQNGLDFELRKKFQGMEFRDFFELVAKVAEYEELLREESYKKKTAMGSYYHEVEDVALAEIRSAGSCTVPLLNKKPAELEKKNNSQLPKDMQYTFDVSKTEEVFDFLVKEKFITFPHDHRMPPTEELKGREYCKYHNSYNHAAKSCWAFKNILQDRINKGVVKFFNKQESMMVDDDHFPPVALINVNVTDLRDLLNEKRSRSFAVKDRVIKKYWIPKGQLFEAHGRNTAD